VPARPHFLLIARLLGDKGVREYAAAARQVKNRCPSAVFALVGRPDVKETRLAVAKDYWQVARGRVNVMLGISKSVTATIEPGGRGHENIPQGRADLATLAKQLAQPLEVRYGSPSCLAHNLTRRAAGECRSPMGGAGTC